MAQTMYIGQRFQKFDTSDSMGVVKDTAYWFCYWPKLDQPTKLFARGSKGLKVAGSSRNVVWPDDTEFLDYYPDALYPAEQFVFAVFPGQRRGMINLTPEMVEVYWAEYERAARNLPKTAAVHSTRADCHFLTHEEPNPEKDKPTRYVAELKPDQVEALMKGDTDVETLKADAEFVPISVSFDKAETVFKIDPVDGGLKEVAKAEATMAEAKV